MKSARMHSAARRGVKRVLVISPHPDDESIGCGGTLRAHTAQGHLVHAVFLTSGERGGHGRPESETRKVREREANAAALVLGIHNVEFWRAPDGALRATEELVARFLEKLKQWRPHFIYVPHDHEMHPDHRAACRLVRRALGFLPKGRGPSVRLFEVWTPIQRIDHIVDISPYIQVKLAAVRAYKSQCSVMRFDQAIWGLSRYRGEMHSWPGGDHAEIFSILRA